MYNASLNLGVAIGAIIDGFIVKYHSWRYIYYTAIALIGALTLIVYVTFPETAYIRNRDAEGHAMPPAADEKSDAVAVEDLETQARLRSAHRPKSYWVQSLKLYHGVYTEEPLWNMALRPVMLLALPPVLWATLVMSVTIGFIVAITSNVSPAFNTAYGFEPWQAGLTFFAGLIGALLGILLGGHFSDWVADQLTKRNGGIREPEMRLPAICIGLITGPLALALYGCGIKYHLHWMVPTLGIGFSMFLRSRHTLVIQC
jgi:MFS family permease